MSVPWRKGTWRKQGNQNHHSSSEAQMYKAEQEDAFSCVSQPTGSYAEGSPNPAMLQEAAQAVKRELFNCAAAIWEGAEMYKAEQKDASSCVSQPPGSYAEGSPNPAMLQEAAQVVKRELLNCAAAIGEGALAAGDPPAPVQPDVNLPVEESVGGGGIGNQRSATGDIFTRQSRDAAAAGETLVLESARHIKYSLQHHLCYCFFHCFESPSFGDISQIGLKAGHFQRPENRRHLLFQEYVRWCRRGSSEEERFQDRGFSSFCSGKLSGLVQLYTGDAVDYKLSPKVEVVTSFLRNLVDEEGRQPKAVSHAFTSLCRTVWVLHKLAMAFEASLEIVRVCAGSGFDEKYMQDEDGRSEDQRLPIYSPAPQVAFMVMPGFILIGTDIVFKARVRLKESASDKNPQMPPARRNILYGASQPQLLGPAGSNLLYACPPPAAIRSNQSSFPQKISTQYVDAHREPPSAMSCTAALDAPASVPAGQVVIASKGSYHPRSLPPTAAASASPQRRPSRSVLSWFVKPKLHPRSKKQGTREPGQDRERGKRGRKTPRDAVAS